MVGLSKALLILGSVAALSGGGYLVGSRYFPGENVPDWEYVWTYDNSGKKCSFSGDETHEETVGPETSQKNCESRSWFKEIISKNSGRQGLWIRGAQSSVNELLGSEGILEESGFQKQVLDDSPERVGIDKLAESCTKKQLGNYIEIECLHKTS